MERKKREPFHKFEKEKDTVPEPEDDRPKIFHAGVYFYACPRCGSMNLSFGNYRKKERPFVRCEDCGLFVNVQKKVLYGSGNFQDTYPNLAALWNKTADERLEHVIDQLSKPLGNCYVGHITLDIWDGKLKTHLEDILGKEVYFKPPEYDANDPGLFIETYRRTGYEYDTVEEANEHRIGKQSKAYINDTRFSGGF